MKTKEEFKQFEIQKSVLKNVKAGDDWNAEDIRCRYCGSNEPDPTGGDFNKLCPEGYIRFACNNCGEVTCWWVG